MAAKGNTELNKGIPILKDAFVVIVKTEWNAHIVDVLETGCKNVLDANNVNYKTVIVPGAFEMAYAIKRLHQSKSLKADAYIALGATMYSASLKSDINFEHTAFDSSQKTCIKSRLPATGLVGVIRYIATHFLQHLYHIKSRFRIQLIHETWNKNLHI